MTQSVCARCGRFRTLRTDTVDDDMQVCPPCRKKALRRIGPAVEATA